MRPILFGFFLVISLFVIFSKSVTAVFDPLSRPNNFHGIHLLFPQELSQAAQLVNSTNGQWGYVTIPIQIGDRDLEKWQLFMDEARVKKLIPIIRLSTESDPFNKPVWRKPTQYDIIDFANFLDSLSWPIENRYVVFFNETNRSDEWGGEVPNPEEYSDLLFYAATVFKQINPDFYIIMGGLDNAAPDDGKKYIDNFIYLKKMISHQPELFNLVDAFSSHSYPNPGFVAPPLPGKIEGITTYQFEYDLINKSANRKIPTFITETGWDSKKLGQEKVASYYDIAYSTIWNKDSDKIVAITPFLLNSQGGDFDIFSFVQNGEETIYYQQAKKMEKVKGDPLIKAVKGLNTKDTPSFEKLISVAPKLDDKKARELFVEYIKFFF